MAELATLERILNEIRELEIWVKKLEKNQTDEVLELINSKIDSLKKAVEAK